MSGVYHSFLCFRKHEIEGWKHMRKTTKEDYPAAAGGKAWCQWQDNFKMGNRKLKTDAETSIMKL